MLHQIEVTSVHVKETSNRCIESVEISNRSKLHRKPMFTFNHGFLRKLQNVLFSKN